MCGPDVNVFSVSALSVEVLCDPEPWRNTRTPSMVSSDTSSVDVTNEKSWVLATFTVATHVVAKLPVIPGTGEAPPAADMSIADSHRITWTEPAT